MLHRGWVKKLPSSLTAAHSALFSHHQTNHKNHGCSVTSLQWHHLSCHQKSTSNTVATASPSPFLHCSIKQGTAKKLWELVVIWLFTVTYHSPFLWIPCSHLPRICCDISLHRSSFDPPLTLLPQFAFSYRALQKTVIIGLVLPFSYHRLHVRTNCIAM